MDETMIATYGLCDDLLQAMHSREDPHQQMPDAEVMTTALIAALYFWGNLESARTMRKTYGYIPIMRSKGRFNRRFHARTPTFLWLLQMLGYAWKMLNRDAVYVSESFPVAIKDISRGALSRGYNKQEAFFLWAQSASDAYQSWRTSSIFSSVRIMQ